MNRLREAALRAVRRSAWWNGALQWWLPRYRRFAVHRDTELVIEGYPRCANTFAVVAFESCQERPVKIAHHLHSLGQVRRGLQQDIPVLVLTRAPQDAVLSLAIRVGTTSLERLFRNYLDFYRGVVPVRNRVLLADFSEVTTDYGQVIRRLNERFGCDYKEFEHTESNVAACYETIDRIERGASQRGRVRETHVARPSEARKAQRDELAERLQEPAVAKLLASCEQAYQQLRSDRSTPVGA